MKDFLKDSEIEELKIEIANLKKVIIGWQLLSVALLIVSLLIHGNISILFK